DEFANELNSLGVRVSNLENRVGNVKVTGDARVRWTDDGIKDEDHFDMRARLQFNAKVADKTTATARISSDNFGFDSKDQDPDLNLDRLYLDHELSDDLHLTAGRYGETFGATGYWYDDAFDGVRLQYKATDAVNASVGYGYAKGMKLTNEQYANLENALAKANAGVKDLEDQQEAIGDEFRASMKAWKTALDNYAKATDENKAELEKTLDTAAERMEKAKKANSEANLVMPGKIAKAKAEADKAEKLFKDYKAEGNTASVTSPEMTYGTLGYNGSNFRVLGTYIAPNGSKVDAAGLDDIWGAGAIVGLNEDFSLSGDYFNVGYKDHDDAEFWNARVDFGHADMKKPGSFNIFVDYVDAEQGSYLGGTGSLRTSSYLNNTESWGAGFGVVVAENVKLEGLRTFSAETKDGADLDDLT
ncbi:putative porin, partial [Negativicoccus succinicivorans]